MQKISFIVLLLLVLGSSAAYADCIYNGQTYSEGTIRGPFICVDGEWIKR